MYICNMNIKNINIKNMNIKKEFHAYETVTPNVLDQKEIAEMCVLNILIEDRILFKDEKDEFTELLKWCY